MWEHECKEKTAQKIIILLQNNLLTKYVYIITYVYNDTTMTCVDVDSNVFWLSFFNLYAIHKSQPTAIRRPHQSP